MSSPLSVFRYQGRRVRLAVASEVVHKTCLAFASCDTRAHHQLTPVHKIFADSISYHSKYEMTDYSVPMPYKNAEMIAMPMTVPTPCIPVP